MFNSGLVSTLAGFAGLVFAAFASTQAFAQGAAQTFPNKPVRILVGFPPGGTSDGAARLAAEGLAAEWKQPVIVENKPGAGTTISAAFVAAAPPDGYTLLCIAPGTHAVSSALYKNLNYDVVKSFVGAGQLAQSAFVVAVNSSSNIQSMKELIEQARARPGQVSYSSSGSGAGPHLVTEMIALTTGVRFLHVPFKGSAPATVALLAGQVDFTSSDASITPHIQSAKLRGLAVSTPKQSQLFPGIPTLAEAGISGVEYVLSLGLAAPAGTPRDVILKISGALGRIVASENFKRRINGLGLEPAQRSADEFDAFLASEARKYAKLVKDIGLKIE